MTLFTGRYVAKVDPSGHLHLPSGLPKKEAPRGVTITRGEGACLYLTPTRFWSELSGNDPGVGLRAPEKRSAVEGLFIDEPCPSAYNADLNSEGWVYLPAPLRRAVGIGARALLLGCRTHVEIWDEARFEESLGARSGDRTLAERAARSSRSGADAETMRMDTAIMWHLEEAYRLRIGERTAERLRQEVQKATGKGVENSVEEEGDGAATVKGRCTASGIPKTRDVPFAELRSILS